MPKAKYFKKSLLIIKICKTSVLLQNADDTDQAD